MKRASLVLAAFALVVMTTSAASAQSYVEGVSAIIGSGTNSTQIETYSETFETPDIAYYYEAYVQGFVYQNGAQINSGYSLGSPYANDAYGYLTSALHVPDTYEIQSDHYAVAYYTYYDPTTGTTYYDNPDYFTNDGSYGGSNDFLPGSSSCGCYYETVDYIYLGSTAVTMSSAPPAISGISPTGVSLGDSGTLTVTGTALVDVFTGTTTATISGTGITWSIGSQTATQVIINYSVATSAPTGSRTLTLSTRFGSSSTNFNVGDGTPVVTSVNPGTWNAGVVTQVTFGGNNFGTAPTLSFNSSQVTATVASSTNTQIVANVTVAAAAPAQTVQVTVTSHGYNGSGFIATNGNSASSTDTATVNPIPAPVPKIMYGGADVTGQSQTVVTGQEVALSTSVSLPSGLVATGSSWTIPGTNVANYSASTPNAHIVPTSVTKSSSTFYWVYAGQGLAVQYSYCMNNNQCSVPVRTTFTVNAVTGANMVIQNYGKLTVDQLTGCTAQGGGPYLVYGNVTGPAPGCTGTTTGTAGIKFTRAGTTPGSGNFFFVQKIATDSRTYTNATTTYACTTTPGVDSQYPYAGHFSATSTTDAPEAPLPSTYTKGSRTFKATMYLMWQSTTANSIPVPLGYQIWQFSGSTTLSGGQWQTPTGSGAPVNGFVPSDGTQSFAGYPTWGNVATETCH